MLRSIASGTVLVVLLLLGCRPAPRAAVIGYSFPASEASLVRVLRAELADTYRDRRTPISLAFLVDPAERRAREAELELGRAERMLATPGLVAVVGHAGSRGALAAAPVYNEARIPQVVPTGTSRALARAGEWTFALAPNDSVEGAFLGAFARRLGARRVNIFYANDEYGLGLRDGVVAELNRQGLAVTDGVPYDLDSDLRTLVDASLQRGMPDVVVIAGRSREAARIAARLYERAPQVRLLLGDGAMNARTLVRFGAPAAQRIYGAVFWLPDGRDSLSRSFVERYRREAGDMPEPGEAMRRDAVMLLARAVEEAGTDPERIRRWLLELGVQRRPFQGVTGPITFTDGRPARLVMAQLRDGALVRVAY